MKLAQAKEFADAYLEQHRGKDVFDLHNILADAYTAGWREGWEDGEMSGYSRGHEAASSRSQFSYWIED